MRWRIWVESAFMALALAGILSLAGAVLIFLMVDGVGLHPARASWWDIRRHGACAWWWI
ncbi:hypothetical protein JKG47_11775 [Acidithiobacillus sp. MC6.1]|nr:hypothetical protein [Acidithiobacillus sp. MC6.1]